MASPPMQSLIAHSRVEDLQPTNAHGFDIAEQHALMDVIYARGDRLMVWFLASHMALALALALYHGTWFATLSVGGGALFSFLLATRLFPRTFFTRAYAGVAQQAFVALHIYQLYGQSEQHFWYFTAFTMMIVYQDWVCMWPGAILIILQHIIFATLHNAGQPVHFFPEPYVDFTKLFYHFGIALVHVSLCGYWAHLLRMQTLGDAWQRLQLGRDQGLLHDQLSQLQRSELRLRETSEQLAASSLRQQAILDNCPDAMWVRDLQWRLVTANSTYARQVGKAVEDLAGLTVHDLLGTDVAAEFAAQDRQVIESRAAATFDREFTLLGEHRNFETTITPIFDADGNVSGTAGIARDVTERKHQEQERERAEARMQHAQKLESLGLLAGGIAHDFNNLLVGILANAELAQADVPTDSPAVVSLSQIGVAAHRAADLTRQMLAYAGKGKVELTRLDMSALVHDMADLLRTVISKNATFRLELSDDLPCVEVDATQLRQVVMNLITNASDALGDASGVITLRTSVTSLKAELPAALPARAALPAGCYVVVEVSDTGAGMTQETLARIFDPFFSTKFVGRGLGLAAVLGIMGTHNGAIDIESAPERGSTFRLYLPVCEALADDVVEQRARLGAPALSPNGSQRLILVVDDEANVRSVAQRVIRRAGYAVAVANDGIEALAFAEAHPQEVSLVLLDMLMPRMNGEQTFDALREIMPHVPVLLTSGFSEEEASQRMLGEPNVRFIQKPFGINQLVSAIEAMIDELRVAESAL